jgi:quercetin dioxygenase-like cupin family protein
MKVFKLNDMTRGWFVGNFEPTSFKTKACEVGYRSYLAGDKEAKHVHKIATELTLITEGVVRMNGIEYKKGDIIVLSPGDETDFEAVTDATNMIVKIPGVPDDKYLV